MFLKEALERIVRCGETFAFDTRNRGHLATVNIMAVFITIYDLLIGIGFYVVLGEFILFGEYMLISAAFACIPLLNHWGFINLSRLLFAFFGCLAVSVISLYLGRETDVHIALLLAACSPFFIISTKERLLLTLSTLAPAFVYLGLGLVNFELGPRLDPAVIEPYRIILSNIFLAFAFFSLLGIAFSFAKQQYDREEELVTAEKKLMHAKNRVETLIGILTHDMANSIMSCNLLLDVAERRIVKEGFQPESFGKSFSKFRSFLENMQDLTNKVVKMRAVQLDIDELDIEIVSVLSMVNKIIDLFSARLREKELTLNRMISDHVKNISVHCDEVVFVNQVIGNIISNAIKFSHQSGTIDLKVEIDENHQVQFLIRDYGIGMPENIILNLFSVEEKASRRGTSGERGTGFGLPLCSHFIAKMSGTIRVESWEAEDQVENQEGQDQVVPGTAFYVTLPQA